MQPQKPTETKEKVIEEFKAFLQNKEFPCVAAKAALERGQIRFFVADHIECPHNDQEILEFLKIFKNEYRNSDAKFHSAVIIFIEPAEIDEEMFDKFLWKRLQALSDLDSETNFADTRVDIDPTSPNFSFSINEEAFFVIGLNPGSSRTARRFKYPSLVFNPHSQFEELRAEHLYEKMKSIVRKRDLSFSGSVNPMLQDYGTRSEVYQYSGRQYDKGWKCPLNIHNTHNRSDEKNSAA